MALSLTKGGNVSLTKNNPGVSKFTVGLGWDARTTTGTDFDLDAFALLVGADGKTRVEKDFVYFNNPSDADGAVVHEGDNLTGQGEGDDEVIQVDLSKVPADVAKVIIAVAIYEADTRSQTFGQVSNAFIRLVDAGKGSEEVRFDLGEDYSVETAVNFAELYRHGEEWKFKAVGQGYSDGMAGIARDYGVAV